VTDRNGNATTLAYSEAGRLEAITDPAGRKSRSRTTAKVSWKARKTRSAIRSNSNTKRSTRKITNEATGSVTDPAVEQLQQLSAGQLAPPVQRRGGRSAMSCRSSHVT
jgi:YD repeat-containing protein